MIKKIHRQATNFLLFHSCSYFDSSIGMESMIMNAPNTNSGEDLVTLEAEISELQRENARVESQMTKLKSDINAIESQISVGERVRYAKNRLVEAEN